MGFPQPGRRKSDCRVGEIDSWISSLISCRKQEKGK
jgi:hypothetical protein